MVTTTANSDNANQQGLSAGAEEFSNEQRVVSADVSTAGTTKFVDSTNVQQQVFNAMYPSTNLVPVRDQNISDFLAKPQLIASGSWSTSAVATTVLAGISPAFFLNTVQVWKNKIEGFGLVRGTAIVRVVLNANPFQQGKLILTFVPLESGDNPSLFRLTTRAGMTQLPNVEIDCRDAAGVLEAPYISPTEYFPRVNDGLNSYDWGQMNLCVLAPLSVGSGGENSADYSIYLHFEDFELAAPIEPQSGGMVKGGSRPARSRAVTSRTEATSIAVGGPISSALLTVSKVAGQLAGIPSISAVAVPLSWMTRGASGVASWFGWSKPLDDKAPIKVARLNLGGMANSTGVSGSSNLGLYHDTSVSVLPSMAGNDYDEMSFNYLKVRKAFVNSFVWATTNGQGDLLYSQKTNGPGEDHSVTGAGVVTYYPPYAYVGRYFRSWRGSVVFTFKIVKTDFHSGRIAVTFTPYPFNGDPLLADSTLCLREIIDVRGKSEFSITVPYLLATAYQDVGLESGTLSIRVLNELRAPPTVNNSISFLVYMSAGDDYEVEVPGSGSTAPIPIVPQIGGVDPAADQTIVAGVVGDYSVTPINMEPSATCVGEMFTSVKQLLTKFTQMVSASDITSTTASIGMYPYTIQTVYRSGITTTAAQPLLTGDALSYFAPGYVLFRGRVKILDAPDVGSGTNIVTLEAALSFDETDPAGVSKKVLEVNTDYTDFFGARSNLLTTSLSGVQVKCLNAHQVFDPINGLDVSVPYYCRTRMSIVRTGFYDPEGYTPRFLDSPLPYLRITKKGAGGIHYHKLFRACSDDFQLAYFIGFPPVWKTRSA